MEVGEDREVKMKCVRGDKQHSRAASEAREAAGDFRDVAVLLLTCLSSPTGTHPPDQDEPSPTQASGTPFNTPPGRREYDHPLHSSALYVLYHHTRKFLTLNLAATSR